MEICNCRDTLSFDQVTVFTVITSKFKVIRRVCHQRDVFIPSLSGLSPSWILAVRSK